MFCQRLGLETGWNCHISLAESSLSTIADEFDEEDDESSIASNTNTDPLLDPEHCEYGTSACIFVDTFCF